MRVHNVVDTPVAWPLRPFLIATLLLVASCDAPGEGRKATAGKALGEEAAAALERFRIAHGHYPDNLAQLYPTYIGSVVKESGHGDTDGISFDYVKRTDGSYGLAFRYFGPGINDCELQPNQATRWKCRGHY